MEEGEGKKWEGGGEGDRERERGREPQCNVEEPAPHLRHCGRTSVLRGSAPAALGTQRHPCTTTGEEGGQRFLRPAGRQVLANAEAIETPQAAHTSVEGCVFPSLCPRHSDTACWSPQRTCLRSSQESSLTHSQRWTSSTFSSASAPASTGGFPSFSIRPIIARETRGGPLSSCFVARGVTGPRREGETLRPSPHPCQRRRLPPLLRPRPLSTASSRNRS